MRFLFVNVSFLQNKEKGGLESLPESRQLNSVDKMRVKSEQEVNNQDPGVNSDDEDDELKV